MKKILFFTLITTSACLAQKNETLPAPDPKVNAKVGKTYKNSTPGILPMPVKAPEGAPNVVFILLDDVGFAASSTFGGPIPTPALDQLAKEGLLFNRFHNAAVCGPSRAALMTGRNHHSVNEGLGLQSAYEGYTAILPKSATPIAEVLKQNGYNTAMFGKHHNTPDGEITMAGPFDRWPNGWGFEYFYGFNGGETDQFAPTLQENNVFLEVNYPEGMTLTQDLANRAISWMQMQKAIAPEKPFFLYFAPGATHAPHQVQKEWIEKFKGQFDQGWDQLRIESFKRQIALGIIPPDTKLTERPNQIPAWDSLSSERKIIGARLMEIYAGFLAQTDYEVGRLIQHLKESGNFDNTIFFYMVGDNGASGEGGPYGVFNEMSILNGSPENPADIIKNIDKLGGPEADNHIPVGFAWALNTPFQWTKQVPSHFGGSRSGMVVSWPNGIKEKGGKRSQFYHLIDIMPTVLDATHISAPKIVNGIKQKPIEGVSMLQSFNNPNAPENHTLQYFEMMSNRAIYSNGWVACAFHGRAPWDFSVSPNYDDEKWELYNINNDFSEATDLAGIYPDKLKEMQKLFDKEAKKYNIYPLDDRGLARSKPEDRAASQTAPREKVTYFSGTKGISEYNAPNTKNKSFSISAKIEINSDSTNGVIVAIGGTPSGWSLYMDNNQPIFVYNAYSTSKYIIKGSKLTQGKHTIDFNFTYDEGGMGKGGTGVISIDGIVISEGRIEKTVPFVFTANETLDVGIDLGTPVGDYKSSYNFSGKIESVTIDTTKK